MKTESECGTQSLDCLETDSQSMAGEAFRSDSSQGGADHTWELFLATMISTCCEEPGCSYLDSPSAACLATTARTTCVDHYSYLRQEYKDITES
jgi:hypothetical protein